MEQEKLLDRIEVRQSAIHGRGIFARKRLRANRQIGRFEGDPTSHDGSHVLWLAAEDGSEIGIRGRNELRFLNHGNPPNAEFRDVDLYALHAIEPGAELLIDYGADWSPE